MLLLSGGGGSERVTKGEGMGKKVTPLSGFRAASDFK